MTKDELLYCDTRCVVFLWHKKRYCIVTQGEILYYDTGRAMVLWYKKRYWAMIQETLLDYAIRSGIPLWRQKRYYTLHIFLLYISKKTIQMFFGKFADEGDNTVKYILCRGNQYVVAQSTTPDSRKCVENLCFFQSGSVIVFCCRKLFCCLLQNKT